MKKNSDLLDHPIFKRLKNFDSDVPDVDTTPAPPVTRVRRRLVPYAQIPMGVRAYRREDSTRHMLTRGHENPRNSSYGNGSYWIDV